MVNLYTIGTWRVSLSAYLDQLKKLGVAKLIDVRGNPNAGRQEDLKRSRQFEQALSKVGIVYEYWGRELGEDAMEASVSDRFQKSCAQLLAIARSQTVCLLGHLHEPQGCHRLYLCEQLLSKACDKQLVVRHLLWKDHVAVRQLEHAKVVAEATAVCRFFEENWARAEQQRAARACPDPKLQLKTVSWNKFDSTLLSDGHAYRFLLPFDTELLWYPHWLASREADELMDCVFQKVTFLHPTYVFQDPNGGFANTLIKRGQVRICGDDCPGAVAAEPLKPWSDLLLRRVEDATGTPFNCFVANHYANGRVVINWHSDSGPGDDEGLGPNPHIGSISLGAERTFSMKSKRPWDGRIVHFDIPLTHGSLLFMGKNSQTHWLHCLPVDEACRTERLNLTFRFFARESTKHIEGVEHNHEWETALGSVRVLLHRGRYGRPILVDIPSDLMAHQLPRFLSTVLPGHRGPMDVSIRSPGAEWQALGPQTEVAKAAAAVAQQQGEIPEVQVVSGRGATATKMTAGAERVDTPVQSRGRWQRRQNGKNGHGRWRGVDHCHT